MHKFENFFVSVDLICYLKLIYLTNDIYVNFAFNLVNVSTKSSTSSVQSFLL